MAIHHSQPGSFTRPQQNTLRASIMPAPTSGIDARAPVGNMPPDVCIYTYNLMPSEYGMILRPGYREWCIDLNQGSSTGVYTMMPFTGLQPGATDDRLFAVTNEGIWDVTEYDDPDFKFTFPSQSLGAGHGVYAHYVDQAANEFLLYADTLNGLHEYDPQTDTWGLATDIDGPTIGAIVFVVVHKQRLWVVEEGSSSAWYLPIASKNGQAEEFYFGAKFPHGGRVAGLFNWTVDGGLGIDDFLVVVSTSGDVVVYQGEDPGSAETWSVRGTYFIGEIPVGRRFASEYSGDLYLLSAFGLISMSDLIRGVDSQNPAETSLSFRVARPLREAIKRGKNDYGWEPVFTPSDGRLVITTPLSSSPGEQQIQYTLNLATEGWGFWRGVPALSLDQYGGRLFFGTEDSKVHVMDVARDAVQITPPEDAENGRPVTFSILSSYQHLGEKAVFKRVQMVRPDFFSQSAPTTTHRVLYDYDFTEPVQPPSKPILEEFDWDVAEWDAAIWTTESGAGQSFLIGASGVGRTVAIAMRGEAVDETRLISWDIMWTTGGPI